MSVYTECSAACDALMDRGEPFTETDVLVQASKGNNWSDDDYTAARRAASAAIGAKYRERKLCRFGPVTVPGMPEPDYLRRGAKIVYASAFVGLNELETPNGVYPRMMIEDDGLVKQGRRLGTNRDDFKPWGEQSIKSPPRVVTGNEADLQAARERIAALEGELARLRGHGASADDLIANLRRVAATLEGVQERLEALETREAARERIYNRAA